MNYLLPSLLLPPPPPLRELPSDDERLEPVLLLDLVLLSVGRDKDELDDERLLSV